LEAKVKHLEFIQAAISRMAGNSFLLKGWTVTLAGSLLALTFKEADRKYVLLSLLVILVFWSLDSFYLSHERRFVALYNSVRSCHRLFHAYTLVRQILPLGKVRLFEIHFAVLRGPARG